MTTPQFPKLDLQSISVSRDALHAYARVLGGWMTACRQKRKHWWHASLRPSLNGLTTDVIHANIDFELELNLSGSEIQGQTSTGEQLIEPLHGQPASDLTAKSRDFLIASGIEDRLAPKGSDDNDSEDAFSGFSTEHVHSIGLALNSVSAAMESFRAGIREETSPIQLWPHHFDLSMLWLPGDKVSGQDPDNEEYADKQMNFGFTFGDAGIPEPYFYITAYPLPDAFPSLQLPTGTTWHSEGFSGALLLYRSLIENADPNGYLLHLWNSLLSAGREQLTTNAT